MKRIIVIGVCLVTAAIVYGFVDYLKTDKKQLQRMYSDEPAAAAEKAPAVPVAQADNRSVSNSLTINALLKKPAPKPAPKELSPELFSRGSLRVKHVGRDSMALMLTPVEKKAERVAVADTVAVPEQQ